MIDVSVRLFNVRFPSHSVAFCLVLSCWLFSFPAQQIFYTIVIRRTAPSSWWELCRTIWKFFKAMENFWYLMLRSRQTWKDYPFLTRVVFPFQKGSKITVSDRILSFFGLSGYVRMPSTSFCLQQINRIYFIKHWYCSSVITAQYQE